MMTTEKRILQSLASLAIALTGFSSHARALELPVSFTSDDKSITFKHTDDLLFSPKPLKTHDKEILFKSETIKGFNAGVTVSDASHLGPIVNYVVTSPSSERSYHLVSIVATRYNVASERSFFL